MEEGPPAAGGGTADRILWERFYRGGKMRHAIRVGRGRRGITVLTLVLLIVAVVIVAVLVSRRL